MRKKENAYKIKNSKNVVNQLGIVKFVKRKIAKLSSLLLGGKRIFGIVS